MVQGTRLESEQTVNPVQGFESPLLRHFDIDTRVPSRVFFRIFVIFLYNHQKGFKLFFSHQWIHKQHLLSFFHFLDCFSRNIGEHDLR